MPTYAYRCVICSHEFSRLERMSAPTRTECPECGERAQRLITGGAGIAVKGAAPQGCADPASSGGCCGGGVCGMN
jgi:putative FmdB family regulatory protein